jgi:hypothetical protein
MSQTPRPAVNATAVEFSRRSGGDPFPCEAAPRGPSECSASHPLSSDPPVQWPVELDFCLESKLLGGAARAFVDSITKDPGVIALAADPVATERTVRATFRLSARTYTEVNELADAILKVAMQAALRAVPAGPPSG